MTHLAPPAPFRLSRFSPALGLSTLLLACSPQPGGQTGSGAAAAQAAAPATSQAAGAEPAASGTATSRADDQEATPRVVALEYSYLDMLAALGVQPVGGALGNTGAERGAPAYLQEYLQGVADVGTRAQPSLEAISALKPDLILADSKTHAEVLPALHKLARTQDYPNRSASYDDVMEQLRSVGELTGRREQASGELDRQAALLASVKSVASAGAPPVLVGAATPEGFWVHSDQSFAGSLFEKVGRRNVARAQDGEVIYQVSLEGLAALNPPSLVLMTAQDETPITVKWAANPLWQGLDAVRANRVYEVDRDLWSRSRGPLSIERIFGQMRDSGLLMNEAPAPGFRARP
ncbi:ABC transporter substrate-binding protein [Deinococcus sp. SL84]|uniref:ABC transporter substrate-binding protein n=1 Tax=Deinococcus sp. SL84 TaxID=2994663 RepID=UPI002272A0DF|nr:ABC transporter substrate-binding protein [Deinococcus sp. SL84]MCY1703464.1 ABC transporter substrate-binding protein [Deinococcus sp. SL84]